MTAAIGGRTRGFAQRAFAAPDLRSYDTAYQVGSYNGISKVSYGRGLSPYARAILATPGLVHWWRFGVFNAGYGALGSFLNSAGGMSISPIGAYSIVPGLIPCDSDGAVKLTTHALRSQDYFVSGSPGGNSGLWAVEWWMRLDSLVNNSAHIGCWSSSGGGLGWMVYANAGDDLSIYMGSTSSTPAGSTGIIAAGKLYHVVVNFADYLDYPSTIFVNGALVATVATGVLSGNPTIGSAKQFEIGSYNNSAGGLAVGTYDEVAIYGRLLQAAEVKQHYDAAFTRL